jgi:cytochrome c biogenesis protein CcdA
MGKFRLTRKEKDSRHPNTRQRFVLLSLLTLAVALAGYFGYVVYPRFHLPSLTGGALLLLAAAAGIASFFSPCSFPLLLSILARAPGVASDRSRATASLAYAAALALGAAVFLILAGLVIALLGTALFAGVTFTSTAGRVIRAAVGVVLIFFGLVQLNRMRFEFRALEPAVHGTLRRQAAFRHEHPLPGFFLFGFGYILAGFG